MAPRPVKVGEAQGGQWVILEGLKAGEQVVVQNGLLLSRELQIARETAEDHLDVFFAAGVALAREIAASPVWVEADATRIAQIIGNLLGNAVKFTRAGEVCLTGRLTHDSTWAFEVIDTGLGIPAEDITVEEGAGGGIWPSIRPPVRVHLRPNSRSSGVNMGLSMDGTDGGPLGGELSGGGLPAIAETVGWDSVLPVGQKPITFRFCPSVVLRPLRVSTT